MLDLEKSTTDIEVLVWIPKDASNFRWFVDHKPARCKHFLQFEPDVQHDPVPNEIFRNAPELALKRSMMNCIFRMKFSNDMAIPSSISLRYTRNFKLKYDLTVVRKGIFMIQELKKAIHRERGSGMTQSYDKRPHTIRKGKVKRQHKDAVKNFDYKTIASRLRLVR